MAPFSFRNGLDIVESPRYRDAYAELCAVLTQLPPYRRMRRMTEARHVISPRAMNRWLDQELSTTRKWCWHPLTDEGSKSQLRSDFRKARIEVEVQFGNVARYAYDLYKMAIAMACGDVDVGVLVLPTQRFAAIIGSNIAYAERAMRELRLIRATLDVPVVVLGIEPETWAPDAYPDAADAPGPIPRTPATGQLPLAL